MIIIITISPDDDLSRQVETLQKEKLETGVKVNVVLYKFLLLIF